MTIKKCGLWALLLISITAQAQLVTESKDPAETFTPLAHDPYKKYNHAIYSFNRFLDRVALKPISKVYDFMAPHRVKKSIGNFFYNLDTLPVIVNDVLQLHFKYAGADLFRFVLNSSVGVLGLFDPAATIFPRHSNDFGLTLAGWGYRDSDYLVLPILGPKTVRDSLGYAFDFFAGPYPYVQPDQTGYELLALRMVSRRTEFLELEDLIEGSSLDRYNFERNAYLQHRRSVIKQVGRDMS